MTEEIRVIEDGDTRKFFTQIPNLVVDDERLTREDRALYLYLKRVAGDDGVCTQSNKTQAERSGLGLTLLKECKQHLIDYGYIKSDEIPGKPAVITIVNIWSRNMATYLGWSSGDQVAGRVATDTRPRGDQGVVAERPGGGRVATTKKNPLRKTHEEEPEEEQAGAAPLEERPAIFRVYEDVTGAMVTPVIHDELAEMARLYPEDWIEDAFTQARGKRSPFAYAKTVLSRWAVEGHQRKVSLADRVIEQQPSSARAQFLQRYREAGGVA